jgi:hypothetical protein
MRDLLKPKGGYQPQIVQDALLVAGVVVKLHVIEAWGENQRAVAYDWAMREHFHASDSPIGRRPRPAFLEPAETETPAVPASNAARPRSCPTCRSIGVPKPGCRDAWHQPWLAACDTPERVD